MVLAQIQNNLHLISALTNFRLINDQHIDVGMQVRERADRFLRFLRDEPTSEERERGERKPPPGFSAGPPPEEAWKSQVRWDAADGPSAPQYGGPRQTGGKFSVVIKPRQDAGVPVPKLGNPAAPGGGGGGGASSMDLLGEMSAPSPAAQRGGGEMFGSDPFGSNGASDPFASAGPDPFGTPPPDDPFFASSSSAPDPFGSSAAPDPFGSSAPFVARPTNGGAPSLIDGPGGQDELLSLALPTNVMPGAYSSVPHGANDMQLLGGLDLASPSRQPDGGNFFPSDSAFGAEPPALAPVPDEWASIKQSSIINLDNLNISSKVAAAPAPAAPASKQSLSQMAGKPQEKPPMGFGAPMSPTGAGAQPMGGGFGGGMGGGTGAPMGGGMAPRGGGMGGPMGGGMGGMPMGGAPQMGGPGGARPMGMGSPPMGMHSMGGAQTGAQMGMQQPGYGMQQQGYGMPQQGYSMQPNSFAQPQRANAMPPMQPRKI